MEILMNKLLVSSIIAAAVSLAGCATTNNSASMEKCYGVAKKGKNDCKTSAHSCAGKSSVDKSSVDFVNVPAGTCQKITGGKVNK